MFQEWLDTTYQGLLDLWSGFIGFVPRLIGALIIFLIGWFVAVGIEKIVARILIQLKFNRLFVSGSWKEALEKAEFKVNPAEFIGAIFKWILIIVFLLIAVEILGFVQFTEVLKTLVEWLPHLVVAIAMFVVAAILSELLGKITVASLEKAKVGYAQLAGKIVRWLIWIFAVFAILLQLQIFEDLIKTILSGLIAALAIAFGLAFGLGGRDLAADLLKSFQQRLRRD